MAGAQRKGGRAVTNGGAPVRPPVLLLHGQPGSARDWERVVVALGDRAAPIAFSRPGWGPEGSATDFAGNAAAAIDELDRRSIQRATVVGHSFGAAIAAMVAIAYPERVQSLVLASPAANSGSVAGVDRLLGAPFVGPLATAATMAGLGLTFAPSRLRSLIAGRLGLESSYLAAGGRLLVARRSWRAFTVEQRALLRDLPDLEQRLPEINVPTTIISGSADTIVPLAAARRLAEQIPGAQLTVLEGAWHLLPQRHAGQLADLIVAQAGAANPDNVPITRLAWPAA